MAWPGNSEYQDAVLNHQASFDDPTLRDGAPELDDFGTPRLRSGNFACVFRIRSGQQNWAVKCFTTEVKDLQERYAAIDEYISPIKIPCIVTFDYLPHGIRVEGRPYPILKMEWMDGKLLSRYIEDHLNSPRDLQRLAKQWFDMIQGLHAHSIAHGDLQERNVIVVDNTLKLVDYDGMFVPTLSGRSSNEIGHRNYQHPQRTSADYGPYLDNFAAWVIYVSIAVLSLDPTLWSAAKAGDDCLLFRREDFEQPTRSPILARLEHHPNENIRHLALLFSSVLCYSLQQVPSLDGRLTPSDLASGASSPANWWADHAAGDGQKEQREAVDAKGPVQDESWILDFILPPSNVPARSFVNPMTGPRLVALMSGLVLGLFYSIGPSLPTLSLSTFSVAFVELARWWLAYLLVTGTILSAGGAMLAQYYVGDPIVKEKRALAERERKASEPLKKLRQALDDNAKRRLLLQSEESQHKNKLNDTLGHLKDQEKRELASTRTALDKVIASVESRERALDQKAQSELGKLQSDARARADSLTQQIASLATAESSEITSELASLQRRYIEDSLRRHSIREAPLSGAYVGGRRNLHSALLAAGIATALDISYARVDAVYGFGQKRTQALVDWRRRLEQQARFLAPNDLGLAARNAIASRYAARREGLEDQREALRAEVAAKEKSLREHYAQEKQPLSGERETARKQATQAMEQISKRYAQEYVAPSQNLVQLTKEFSAKVCENDEQAKRLREQMFAASGEATKANLECKSYRNTHLANYLKAVFFGLDPYAKAGRAHTLGLGLVYAACCGFIVFRLGISPVYSLSQAVYVASAQARAQATEVISSQMPSPLVGETATSVPTPLPTEQPTATESPVPTATPAPTVTRVLPVAPIATKAPTLSPTPVCALPNARITYPTHNSTIRGTVQIRGSASRPDLNYYKVQFRQEGMQDWAELHQDRSPVVDGILAEWNTSSFEPLAYWLRLVVADPTGNYYEPCEIRVLVAR
ncbi:MAG: hypothetical protein M1570_10805 [Chloroflexi bacterium]|nr:hypothetical protein [Chloroflexota bacterium]